VYQNQVAQKLGLLDDGQESNMLTNETEAGLVHAFWEVLAKTGADFTNTFRDLASVTKSAEMTSRDEAVLDKIV